MVQPKKILAFAMLLVVAAPLFFLAAFFIKQKLLQHAMKEKLERSFLQTITVNQGDITWVKKNKEIILEGKLFDVKSFVVSGAKVTLTGLYDEDEIKLKLNFANILYQKKNQPDPLNQALLKFIFSSAILKSPACTTLIISRQFKPVYLFYDELIATPFLSVKTPPPNV